MLSFQQPVTIITGPNHVGKSALVRALKWGLLNKGNPNKLIRRESKSCSVSMLTSIGKIERRRDGKENTYHFNGYRYAAIRKDIPKEMLNQTPITDTNFQEQHDSLYWMNLSGSQVSSNLNELVNLASMDIAMNYCKKKLSGFIS